MRPGIYEFGIELVDRSLRKPLIEVGALIQLALHHVAALSPTAGSN